MVASLIPKPQTNGGSGTSCQTVACAGRLIQTGKKLYTHWYLLYMSNYQILSISYYIYIYIHTYQDIRCRRCFPSLAQLKLPPNNKWAKQLRPMATVCDSCPPSDPSALCPSPLPLLEPCGKTPGQRNQKTTRKNGNKQNRVEERPIYALSPSKAVYGKLSCLCMSTPLLPAKQQENCITKEQTPSDPQISTNTNSTSSAVFALFTFFFFSSAENVNIGQLGHDQKRAWDPQLHHLW